MMLYDYLTRSAQCSGAKTAVCYQDTRISFLELDEYSGKIGQWLSGQNRIGQNIGILMSKSIEAVSAIFGILKAGAVYVPLDIDSPVERLAYIIDNCQIKALFADRTGLKKILNHPEHFRDITIVNLSPASDLQEPPLPIIAKEEIDSQTGVLPVPPNINEEAPAYILYTSGSTGQPKGVVLTHKNATVFVEWAVNRLRLKADDIFSSHAPFYFDLSIFDIFAAMKTGATLCLIPKGIAYFPAAIVDFIEKNRITVWYSVPSALIQLLGLSDLKARLTSLRIVIYAGEVFPYSFLNQFLPVVTDCQVFNFYGPTETNVITYYELPANSQFTADVPIGKACDYARLAVVDENGRPVKKGETGQLVARGESLMVGYWGDPEKTAQKIKRLDPGVGGNQLYYFTGDLARENENHELIYLGRMDTMIKTRGFRVELGEIEAALRKHDFIKETAVIAVADEQIGARIIAFIVAPDGQLSPESVSAFCKNLIPYYMVPEQYYFLDKIPLTSTGKLDLQSLLKIARQK